MTYRTPERGGRKTTGPMTSGVLRHAGRMLRGASVLSAILGMCGAGVWLALSAAWPTDMSADPTIAILGVIRVAALGLSLWVGSITLAAIFGRLLRRPHISETALRLLPSAVRAAILRWVIRPAVTVAVISGITVTPSRGSVSTMDSGAQPSTSAVVAEVNVTGDVTNGQRWPVVTNRAMVDPEAPTLSRVGSAPKRRSQMGQLVPATPGIVSVPATGVTSTPVDPASTGASPNPYGATPSTVEAPPGRSASPPSPGIGDPDRRPPTTWTVRPGDHFWSVARRTVRHVHPGATEHEIQLYCSKLIDINRGLLADPSNPDLLHIGTVLNLPDVHQKVNDR